MQVGAYIIIKHFLVQQWQAVAEASNSRQSTLFSRNPWQCTWASQEPCTCTERTRPRRPTTTGSASLSSTAEWSATNSEQSHQGLLHRHRHRQTASNLRNEATRHIQARSSVFNHFSNTLELSQSIALMLFPFSFLFASYWHALHDVLVCPLATLLIKSLKMHLK